MFQMLKVCVENEDPVLDSWVHEGKIGTCWHNFFVLSFPLFCFLVLYCSMFWGLRSCSLSMSSWMNERKHAVVHAKTGTRWYIYIYSPCQFCSNWILKFTAALIDYTKTRTSIILFYQTIKISFSTMGSSKRVWICFLIICSLSSFTFFSDCLISPVNHHRFHCHWSRLLLLEEPC